MFHEQNGYRKRTVSREEYLMNPAQYAVSGTKLPHAKLTPAKVREIRIYTEQGKTARWIADLFGVHYRTIQKIRHYETWRNVI
jgi:DNA-binding CsgD family transcriptional regulator